MARVIPMNYTEERPRVRILELLADLSVASGVPGGRPVKWFAERLPRELYVWWKHDGGNISIERAFWQRPVYGYVYNDLNVMHQRGLVSRATEDGGSVAWFITELGMEVVRAKRAMRKAEIDYLESLLSGVE